MHLKSACTGSSRAYYPVCPDGGSRSEEVKGANALQHGIDRQLDDGICLVRVLEALVDQPGAVALHKAPQAAVVHERCLHDLAYARADVGQRDRA
eukprot:scaffold192050_cov33-Tisochrysis_lutea.AAC.4